MRAYIRQHHLALLCLFLIVGGGTAYAVDGPLAGQNTVGSEDIIGNEIKSDDIGNGRIFNLDIADEVITGQKLKNGTVGASDLAPGAVPIMGSPIGGGGEDSTVTDGMVKRYFGMFVDDFGNQGEGREVWQLFPVAGTVSDFRVILEANPGAFESGDSYEFTVTKNVEETDLSCTVTELLGSCQDLADSVSFTPGDRISIVSTEEGTPDTLRMRWMALFTPSP